MPADHCGFDPRLRFAAVARREKRAAGFKLDVEPFDTEWKTRQFELTDPTGYEVTVSSEWPRD